MKRNLCLFWVLILIFGLCSCAKKVPTWQEQYDLGVRYLSDGNYEEAILAFTAAIEIDSKQTDTYAMLADLYRKQGQYDLALEILSRGYDATQSPLLLQLLNAEEANQRLSNEELRNSFERLFSALEQNDRTAAADYFESWIRLNGGDPYSDNGYMRNLNSYSGLLFDGEHFYAKSDNIGMLFGGPYKIYFGDQKDGRPHGKGVLLATNTWYPEGGISYYWQAGTWDAGKAVGPAEIWEDVTTDYTQEDAWGWRISCTFNEAEVMETADAVHLWTSEGQTHEFAFHVKQGKLLPEEWHSNQHDSQWYDGPACQNHGNCRTSISVEEIDSVHFQNSWSWGSSVPYDCNYFGSYSFGGY